jgi:hypothetical protein
MPSVMITKIVFSGTSSSLAYLWIVLMCLMDPPTASSSAVQPEAAGWGVCLKNGFDPTKAVAQAVTEYGVEEDGVGRYLETHWFNR